MKRMLARILLSVMLLVCLIPAAAAVDIEPYASDYFDGCTVTVGINSSGKLEVQAKATATDVMRKLGVSEITIQKKGLVFWSGEITQTGTTANGYIKTNVSSYDKTFTFSSLTLSSGEQYRAVVTFYAEDNSGSDSITKTSTAITVN